MNSTIFAGQVEAQAHIEEICKHYGVSDVFEVKAAGIANEWVRIEQVDGGFQPFLAAGLYEFILERATRNTTRLAEFVEFTRTIRKHK